MATVKMMFYGLALAGCMLQAQDQTRLLRLNVVAVDSKGAPVTDLAAEDFRITDEGKPQRIAFFHRSGGDPNAAPADAHEYSNRPVPGPHTTAILFDFLNENRTDRLDAARKIGQSLKQLPSGESVYFYLLTLDGTLNPIHAMPTGPGGAADKTWTQGIEALLAKAVKANSGNRPAGMLDEEAIKKTYVALETLANQLAAFDGRRDILWVTNKIPNVWNPKTPCNGDWIDCALYVPHLSVTLDRSGAVVNPISYTSLDPNTNRDMEDMAGLTGGQPYFGEEMHTVIKRLDDEASGTYAIAYEPTGENGNSKFHKVKVTCERKGIKVQAKQRYYSLPDTRTAPVREQALLAGAYQSLSDISDIGVHAAVTPAPNKVRVDMRIDAADLLLRDNGGQADGQLTVLFSTRGAGGPQGEPTLSNLDLHLTKEQRDAAMKYGIPISREVPVDAATQRVRLIVLDRGTGSIGSLTIPIAPPK